MSGPGALPPRRAGDAVAPASAAEQAAAREERSSRAQARRARAALDWVLSASAGLVALSALGVSVYQTPLHADVSLESRG